MIRLNIKTFCIYLNALSIGRILRLTQTPKSNFTDTWTLSESVLHKPCRTDDMHATVRYRFPYLYILLNLRETIKSSSDKTALIVLSLPMHNTHNKGRNTLVRSEAKRCDAQRKNGWIHTLVQNQALLCAS